MNLSTKQKQTPLTWITDRKKGWGREGMGVWGQPMQTIVYLMDKQQGPTVYSTGNYIQHPLRNRNERRI